MNFLSRRTALLTRGEIMGYIAESALERRHHEAFQTDFPAFANQPDGELRALTHQACEQASQELAISPEEQAVARGVLAQQVALEQAIEILERKICRSLTDEEKRKICQELPSLIGLGEGPQENFPPIRGPRTSPDVWES